jgi:hypothetical protein
MDMAALDYFREPGPHSTANRNRMVLKDAPTDIAELAAWIQGRMLHEHWASRYGEELTPERRALSHSRSVDAVLDGVVALGNSPRPPAGRAVGVCSHFSLLAVSAIRANGLPARSRCGFGTYFAPDKAIDHWVVEVWNGDHWRMVDFQIDDFQRAELGLEFDTLDLPPGKFLLAAEAWQLCRRGEGDPNRFGIFDEGGFWFIASNMIRDLASLNKVEMLPWDDWGAMPSPDGEISTAELQRFDHLAEVLLDPDRHLEELHSLYAAPGFGMTGEVFNAVRQVRETVSVAP